MDDSRDHMQVRCENCGFPFDFAVSGLSPPAVCPACGSEMSVTHCHRSDCSEKSTENHGRFRQELFRIGVTRNDLLKCRAKNCPRLRRDTAEHVPSKEEIGCGGTAIPFPDRRPVESEPTVEPVGPRRILALSVAVQIFILVVAGVLMFKAFRGEPEVAGPPKSRPSESKTVRAPKPKPTSIPEKHRSVAPPFVASKPDSPVPSSVAKTPAPASKPVAAPNRVVPEKKAPATPAKPAPVVASKLEPTPKTDPVAKPTATPPKAAVPKEPVTAPVPVVAPPAPKEPAAPPAPPKVAAPKEPVAAPPPVVVPPPAPKKAVVPPTPPITPPPPPPTSKAPNAPSEPVVTAKTTTLPPKSQPEKKLTLPELPTEPAKPAPSQVVPNQDEMPTLRKTEDPRLGIAEKMLETAMASLASHPEKSLEDALHAVKLYGELKRPVPPATYWLLGQTYAALSWGKMFLVNSPATEEMTISSDSHWLMTRRRDETVWIWDVFRDQEHRSGFQLNTGTVRFASIRFTPDMRLIVGGQEDGTIRLWDLSRQEPGDDSLQLRETVPGLVGLEISPDGRWLIAYGEPGAGQRISRSDRYLRPSPEPVEESASAMVVANGPPRMAANSLFDGMPAPVWKITEDPVARLSELSLKSSKASPIANAARSPETMRQVTYLAAVTPPETPAAPVGPSVVWLWDLQRLHNGTLPAAVALHGHESRIHAVGFSRDSRQLALGGADSVTRIYDLQSKTPQTPTAELRGHRQDVTALAFAPGGRWIATGSRDNTIRLWSLDGKSESMVLNGHLGWISAMVIDSKGKKMYSGSYDKTVRIWNIHPERIGAAAESPSLILQNDQGVIQELGLTVDETRLVSRGGDGSLRIRDLGDEINNRHSVMFRNRMLPITHFVVSPDNRWLIFSYVNQRNPSNSGVRLWPLGLDHLVEIVGE